MIAISSPVLPAVWGPWRILLAVILGGFDEHEASKTRQFLDDVS